MPILTVLQVADVRKRRAWSNRPDYEWSKSASCAIGMQRKLEVESSRLDRPLGLVLHPALFARIDDVQLHAKQFSASSSAERTGMHGQCRFTGRAAGYGAPPVTATACRAPHRAGKRRTRRAIGGRRSTQPSGGHRLGESTRPPGISKWIHTYPGYRKTLSNRDIFCWTAPGARGAGSAPPGRGRSRDAVDAVVIMPMGINSSSSTVRPVASFAHTHTLAHTVYSFESLV